jgi:ribosomal protein S18 acetylase RimI-like enzyme
VDVQLDTATPADVVAVLAEHARFWGKRDLRHLHQMALVHEFPETCLMARSQHGIVGYLLGFVTPSRVGYIHVVATREDARGSGLGRRLYLAFANTAARQGATMLKAITSLANTGSIAFHRALGFEATVVDDYAGPGNPRVVFRRPLPLA